MIYQLKVESGLNQTRPLINESIIKTITIKVIKVIATIQSALIVRKNGTETMGFERGGEEDDVPMQKVHFLLTQFYQIYL